MNYRFFFYIIIIFLCSYFCYKCFVYQAIPSHTKHNTLALQKPPSEKPLVITTFSNHKNLREQIIAMHNDIKLEGLSDILQNDNYESKRLPVTILAFYNNELAGSCSITHEDPYTIVDYTPWVNYLFVKPDFRGKKIARALIKRILEISEELGYSEIFYLTHKPEHVAMYTHLGGTTIRKVFIHGCECHIMEGRLKNLR